MTAVNLCSGCGTVVTPDGEGDHTEDCQSMEMAAMVMYEAEIAQRLRSQDPCEVLEVVMQCHLPVRLPDDTGAEWRAPVMCLCHGESDDGKVTARVFDGPVFHRQHVAAIQWAALRAAGHVQ